MIPQKKLPQNFISFSIFRFTNDIYEMTGYRPGIYWQVTWRYVGPLIVSVILLSSLVFMVINPPTYSAWNAEEVSLGYSIIF